RTSTRTAMPDESRNVRSRQSTSRSFGRVSAMASSRRIRSCSARSISPRRKYRASATFVRLSSYEEDADPAIHPRWCAAGGSTEDCPVSRNEARRTRGHNNTVPADSTHHPYGYSPTAPSVAGIQLSGLTLEEHVVGRLLAEAEVTESRSGDRGCRRSGEGQPGRPLRGLRNSTDDGLSQTSSEQLLSLLRALATLGLRPTEELGQLGVTRPLGVANVGLES